MDTIAVNIYKEKYDEYCGRAGKGKDGYYGNPFRLDKEQDRQLVMEKYRVYFYERIKNDPEFKRRIHSLKGKRLGCFCKPKPCHVDIIVEYLNNL